MASPDLARDLAILSEKNTETVRTPRTLDTREETVRTPLTWKPAQLLPDPEPEPGYSFRWVRVSTLGQADPRNISVKQREGWEPVKASTQPHMVGLSDRDARFPDSIEIGGLVLCKAPKELTDQRDAYYKQQADSQMTSVDNNFMRENDPRMPLFKDRRSEVKFGKSRPN